MNNLQYLLLGISVGSIISVLITLFAINYSNKRKDKPRVTLITEDNIHELPDLKMSETTELINKKLKYETPELDGIVDIERGLELSEINKRNIERISNFIKQKNYEYECYISKYGK